MTNPTSISACFKAIFHGFEVKLACSAITAAIFTVTGTNLVLYHAVVLAWLFNLPLGLISDWKSKAHPYNSFSGAFVWLVSYLSLILITHQIARIYPSLAFLVTLTAGYCAINEVLKAHRYAQKLGFVLIAPLTQYITKYLDNLTNDGGQNKR